MSSIAESDTNLVELAGANKPTVHNLLRLREPEIAQRLTVFRDRVNDLLLDQLAATFLHDPTCRVKEGQQPVPELNAVAVALHMLTRDSWNAEDFKVFDSCWREITLSDLFDDFESDRFRIQKCVEEAREACLSHIHFDNSAAVFYPESSTMPREARLPRKKPAESRLEPLVNHPLVRHAVKVFNATVVEPDSDEALQSRFVQPEVKTKQVADNEADHSGQETPQPSTGNRVELLRQFGALDDDSTISKGRNTRR